MLLLFNQLTFKVLLQEIEIEERDRYCCNVKKSIVVMLNKTACCNKKFQAAFMSNHQLINDFLYYLVGKFFVTLSPKDFANDRYIL